MYPRRLMIAVVPLAGVAVCVIAVVSFVLTIVQNTLPWSPRQTIRDHYLAVGASYSQGFLAGFFLCLFLVLAGIVATGMHHRAPSPASDRYGRTPREAD